MAGGYAVALTLAAALAAGCAGDEERSRRARRADPDFQAPPPPPPTPRRPWAHAADVESLRVVRERVRSTHFTGEGEAELRVNELAAAYGQRGATLPPGSLLVSSQERPEGLVRFVMERPPGAAGAPPPPWQFAVVAPDGKVALEGRIELCVRCHAEAPADEVFGPPGL